MTIKGRHPGCVCIGACWKTHLAELLVQLVNLLTVAVEDLHERRLGASSSLGTTEEKRLPDQLDILEVHDQVLGPLRRALADGDGLGDLVVGVPQGRQVLVLHRKLRQVADDLGQLGQDEVKALLHEDELAREGACMSVCNYRGRVDSGRGTGAPLTCCRSRSKRSRRSG